MSVTEVPDAETASAMRFLRPGDLVVDSAQILEVLEGQRVAGGLNRRSRLELGEDATSSARRA